MGLKSDLQDEVGDILQSRWDERDGTVVPEDENIGLGNDAVKLKGTVLICGHRWFDKHDRYTSPAFCRGSLQNILALRFSNHQIRGWRNNGL